MFMCLCQYSLFFIHEWGPLRNTCVAPLALLLKAVDPAFQDGMQTWKSGRQFINLANI